MPGPSMSGAELGGRLIALEAAFIAIAGELLASLPQEKAPAVFAGMRAIAHELASQLAPEFGSTPPLVKQIAAHADGYVDAWAESIEKVRAKIVKDGAIAKAADA